MSLNKYIIFSIMMKGKFISFGIKILAKIFKLIEIILMVTEACLIRDSHSASLQSESLKVSL